MNEQIRHVTTRFGVHVPALLILCECDDPECLERLEVPTRVYDEIRGDEGRFVVIAGHDEDVSERVLASDGYAVVRRAAPVLRLAPSITAHEPLPAA